MNWLIGPIAPSLFRGAPTLKPSIVCTRWQWIGDSLLACSFHSSSEKKSTTISKIMPSNLTSNSFLTSGQMKMPIIGLGTWQASEKELEIALPAALEAGYRHIDTAYLYENEKHIGKALNKYFNEGKLKRENLFIVTKLPFMANRAEFVETYLKKSLDCLQIDYVDLYLIHYPAGLKNHGPDNLFPKNASGKVDLDLETDLISLWKAMEAQVDAGRAKSIGVSNFNKSQIEKILKNCRIPIANNQIEMHVYLQQTELLTFCKDKGITVCAYAPLGSPGFVKGLQKLSKSTEGMIALSPLEDPVIIEIAKQHNKLPSQVLLRFLIEQGVAVIPKSTNPLWIKRNIDIFDFHLTKEELEKIKSLNRGEKGRMFGAVGDFAEIRNHPEYPHPKIS